VAQLRLTQPILIETKDSCDSSAAASAFDYSESMASDRMQSDRTVVHVVGLLRRGAWSAVPTAIVESLVASGRTFDFASGRTMYTEADAERLAIMLHGLLRVYMHAGDGRQVTVRYVRAGDLLGAPALIGGPAPVFVQAVTDGTAFFFDIDRVKRAARNDASLAWALAEESVHRLYDILEELAGNTFASVRQRVARHLLDLATSRLDVSRTLTAFVNQQDLANSVGSVREVVARVLAQLRSEHLVRTSPGRVEILDPVRMSQELWSRARDQSHIL
jgi:CRP/FNR family transcriptional regulator